MSLVSRIRRALDEQPMDPDEFERAACALLSAQYPWLSPVEGGTDLGRDADVYRVSPNDPESRGRLLATTGDPLANLKRSWPRWVEEGLRVDQVVIACSQPVGGKMRTKLERECREHGFPLPEIYGRDWLVRRLVEAPEWREVLLGIKGRLEALTSRPYGVDEPTQGLVGRSESLIDLKSAVAASYDVVVTGVPGVGKTRLLLELSDEVLFVEPAAADHLADDLLAFRPSAVAIDDAHLNRRLLAELVRLREQEGLTFSVLAVTWPDQEADVVQVVPGAASVRVDLLSRAELDALIQAAGIRGVHARQVVLDQAQGRPGWALALCNAFISGEGTRVVSGDALLDHVERFVRQASDSAVTQDALACLSALGSASQGDLERISTLVGAPSAALVGSIEGLATNGLIDRQHGRCRLQPWLRAPLVARWFFGDGQRRSWASLERAFPERGRDLTLAMLHAAALDAAAPAGETAKQWADQLPQPAEWDEPTFELVLAYAGVSEEAADFACERASAVMQAPRELQTTAWGHTYDPVGIAASGVLRQCAQRWFNKEAVRGLLTLAVNDDRPRDQHTEHPMRVLRDMAGHIDPDVGAIYQLRRLLLDHAIDWVLRTGERAERRVTVFCEAVRYALRPTIEGNWLDPAERLTLSLAHGTEQPERLAEMVALWSRVEPVLRELGGVQLPPTAVAELLELFEEWLRLAGGHGPGPNPPIPEQMEAGATGAWTIYRTLHPAVSATPGLALRAHRILQLARRWGLEAPGDIPELALDEDLLLLEGKREIGEDIEGWLRKRDEETAVLAQRIVALGPTGGTGHLAALIGQAKLGGSHGGATPVARHVAIAVPDAGPWLDAAQAAGLPGMVFGLVLERPEALTPGRATQCLQDERVRASLVRAVLQLDALTPGVEAVIDALGPDDAWALDSLFAKEAADPVLSALLQHGCREIRAMTAVSLAVDGKHGPALPPEWTEAWTSAFLEAEPSTVRGHSDWLLGERLKQLAQHQPQLCASWFHARLSGPETHDPWNSGFSDLEPIAATLPHEDRKALARASCETPGRPHSLLRHLVGHDAALAAELIEEGILEASRGLAALSGYRDGGARTLIPVLVAHGVSPSAIADVVCGARSWEGRESDDIRRDLAWFAEFERAVPAVAPVCGAARVILESSLERALEKERQEAIRGWA